MARWEQQAITLRGKAVVVQHDNWAYLVDWLQLTQVATIEPRPGIPPSGADQKRLLETLSRQKPAQILAATHENPKAAHWLGKQLGVPVVILPFTVGADDATQNLPALFDRTLQLLGAGAP
jgi:zinc/manganese transport system substrate-binding protein